jgi:hypothetical protein
MTTLTAPAPQANPPSNNGEKPINLFQLGCLFVIRASYWSCRIGNEPQDFHLSPARVESKAIASFGSKELIDPHKGRKVFQQIEKKARHQLAKYSKPFPAANAHFVPWEHAPELIDKLEGLKAEFDQAVEDFLLQYPQLRADWQFEHPDVPDAAYPAAAELRKKFSFGWHTFKVAGAASAMAVDDIQAELASQQLRDEQLVQMKQNLQSRVPAVRQRLRHGVSQGGRGVLRPGDRRRRQGPRQDAAGHPPQDRALPRHEHLQRRRHGRAAQRAQEPDLRPDRRDAEGAAGPGGEAERGLRRAQAGTAGSEQCVVISPAG